MQELLVAMEDGLDELTLKLSDHLSLPIIISDTYYNVISTSMSDSQEIAVSTHFESYQNTAFFKCDLHTSNEKFECFGYPIKSKNQIYGYLFLLINHENNHVIEQYGALLNYVASLYFTHLKQQHEIKKEKQRFKDAFLFDILYGNFKSKEEVTTYGGLWKWDLDQPHMVAVFTFIDYNHFSNDRQLLEGLLYIIEKTLSQHGLEPIAIRKQSEIIALFPVNEQTHFHEKKKVIEFIQYMKSRTDDKNFVQRIACGIGQTYENPIQLYKSYQEAKVAYELGLLLKIEFPFFHDLGIERVLYKHDLQDLREFFQHVVGELQKYDDENESDLMDTLENFANHQFDLKQTSEAIFLHRNTLRYRIKKIEEILNIKLDDMNNRLNIMAAFKIKTLHKI